MNLKTTTQQLTHFTEKVLLKPCFKVGQTEYYLATKVTSFGSVVLQNKLYTIPEFKKEVKSMMNRLMFQCSGGQLCCYAEDLHSHPFIPCSSFILPSFCTDSE